MRSSGGAFCTELRAAELTGGSLPPHRMRAWWAGGGGAGRRPRARPLPLRCLRELQAGAAAARRRSFQVAGSRLCLPNPYSSRTMRQLGKKDGGAPPPLNWLHCLFVQVESIWPHGGLKLPCLPSQVAAAGAAAADPGLASRGGGCPPVGALEPCTCNRRAACVCMFSCMLQACCMPGWLPPLSSSPPAWLQRRRTGPPPAAPRPRQRLRNALTATLPRNSCCFTI